MKFHRLSAMILSLIAVCVFVCLCVAEPSARSSITGVIAGPDGSRLPGARVTARLKGTTSAVQVASNSSGMYRITELEDGEYELTAELQGFESLHIANLNVSRGSSKVVDIEMRLATVRTTISVVGFSPKDSMEAAETRESSARDVGEALANEAGVYKIRKGGIANDIVLRGFPSKDLNVLIDGQRVYGACPNQMDPVAFHVDFAEVNRIEVGKGPFDVKNQGSLGGVVNIVTQKAEKGYHATGNVSAGSYDFINPSASMSYGGDIFSILGGYSYRSSLPYTDGSGRRFTEITNFRPGVSDTDAFRAGTVWASVSGSPASGHLVQVSYAHQGADHVLYPYLQMDAVYDDTDRLSAGYSVDNPFGLVRSLKFHTYFTQVNHWMTDEYRTSSMNFPRPYSMGTQARTNTLGGKIETLLNTVTVGVEAYHREWNATTMLGGMLYAPQFSIPDVRTDSIGLYSEYERSLSDAVKLSFGGRLDTVTTAADESKANTGLYYAYNGTQRTSTTNNFPSGNARMSYKLSFGMEVSGGIGHTVRVPDARERYFALKRMGADWVGNPLLKPSRNTGLDGNLSFRHQNLHAEANLYFDFINNYVTVIPRAKINSVPGVMNSRARSYQNVDARMYGGEFNVSYLATQRLFLSSDVSYVRGTRDVVPASGVLTPNLSEIPPLRFQMRLRYDTGKYFGEAEGIFSGAQHNVDSELGEQSTPGYGIANLRAGAHYKGINLTLALNNLFGRMYYEHLSYQRDPFRSGVRVPEPGRNFFVNLSYRY